MHPTWLRPMMTAAPDMNPEMTECEMKFVCSSTQSKSVRPWRHLLRTQHIYGVLLPLSYHAVCKHLCIYSRGNAHYEAQVEDAHKRVHDACIAFSLSDPARPFVQGITCIKRQALCKAKAALYIKRPHSNKARLSTGHCPHIINDKLRGLRQGKSKTAKGADPR